jgi:uncharacterized membrane protein YhaH (DUF805 family)
MRAHVGDVAMLPLRGTFGMDFARGALRDLSYAVWALLALVLSALAGVELASAVANAHWRFVALCAVALAAALATLSMALRRLRGKPVRGGAAIALLLTVTATLLVLFVLAISAVNAAS